MAKFEVVVEEFHATPEEIEVHPETSGIPLAVILERTGGSYVWDFKPHQHMRDGWLKTASRIEDRNLAQVARSESIPISLEHLRDRDPATTRLKIRFEVVFDAPEEAAKFGRSDDIRFQ